MTTSGLDEQTLMALAPVLDALPFYVIVVAEDHTILATNKAVQRELDRVPEELLGCQCPVAVHGVEGAYDGCPLEQSIEEGGQPVEKEFYDEGTGKWVESMIYPVPATGASGKRMFLHFVRDISERKRLEQVANSRERLARVGEFSAGIAHTMRNPLHGLLNSVSHLHKRLGGEDPEAAEILDWMKEGLTRMETTTRRLLTLTREAPLVKRPVELSTVVRDALTLVSERVRQGGPALEQDMPQLPPIHLDPDRLGEVVMNLLDNAVDACKDDGTVTARTRLATAEEGVQGGQVLEVQDTGAGIPEEIINRVFEPFFTTKGIGGGSGLGLAIARRVVREHGGEVEILSEEGNGTTIRVSLPAK